MRQFLLVPCTLLFATAALIAQTPPTRVQTAPNSEGDLRMPQQIAMGNTTYLVLDDEHLLKLGIRRFAGSHIAYMSFPICGTDSAHVFRLPQCRGSDMMPIDQAGPPVNTKLLPAIVTDSDGAVIFSDATTGGVQSHWIAESVQRILPNDERLFLRQQLIPVRVDIAHQDSTGRPANTYFLFWYRTDRNVLSVLPRNALRQMQAELASSVDALESGVADCPHDSAIGKVHQWMVAALQNINILLNQSDMRQGSEQSHGKRLD